MRVPHDLAVKESESWCRHFGNNAVSSDRLPWDDPTPLSREESRCIRSSIQQFQLAEGSSGSRLLKRGWECANTAADPRFIDALKLFVKEEQRHSAHLLRFMQREGIAATSKHWVDTVFRRLRALAGLELSLRVLVSAEIIAIPYYQALSAATKSPLLKAICTRFLQDEAAHLRFQASMLSRLSASRTYLADHVVAAIHRVFLLVTCYIVWFEHGRVFRAAGYSRGGFLAETFWEFARLDSAVGCGPTRARHPGEYAEHNSDLLGAESVATKNRN